VPPVAVVFGPPRIDRSLCRLNRSERRRVIKEIGLCRVWCQRSTLAVVVGEYGLLSSWRMPFLRQIARRPVGVISQPA